MRDLLIPAAAIGAIAAGMPAAAAERTYNLAGFDRVELGGSSSVAVTTGGGFSVHAAGEVEALDRLKVYVEDGALRIEPKNDNWLNWTRDHGRVRFTVTMPKLNAVGVGGSGDVTASQVSGPFKGSIGGSGNITLARVAGGDVKFSIGGSGAIKAAGRCDNAEVSVAGSASAELGGLSCSRLKANVAGSGDIDITANQTAAISIAGSGDVRVRGGAKCTVSSVGSGKAHCE